MRWVILAIVEGFERGGISIESGGFAGECRKSESWRSAAVG